MTHPPTTPGRDKRPPRERLLETALAYAARGWHVHPLWPGTKISALHGRRHCRGHGPCTGGHRGWPQRATTDPDLIRTWWARRPCNIGIACGPSRLLVIDLDVPAPGERPPPPWDHPSIRSGADLFRALAERAGHPPPVHTYTVTTPSGGTHHYYRAPAGVRLRNTTGSRRGLGWRIDTRAAGGTVVAAGSIVDGRPYTVTLDRLPQPLPLWLTHQLTPPPPPPLSTGLSRSSHRETPRSAHDALRRELDRVLAARPGERNNTLNTAAYVLGQFVAVGALPEQLAETALLRAGTATGLPQRETHATVHSGLDAGIRHRHAENR